MSPKRNGKKAEPVQPEVAPVHVDACPPSPAPCSVPILSSSKIGGKRRVISVSPEKLSVFDVPFSDVATLESIYLKIVEGSPDAMIVIDRRGLIIVFNTAAELMFDYAREDVTGKLIEMLLPDDRRDRHKGHRQEYFEEPRVREMGLMGQVLEGVRRDGSVFQLQIKLSPMVVPTKGAYALAVIRRVKK